MTPRRNYHSSVDVVLVTGLSSLCQAVLFRGGTIEMSDLNLTGTVEVFSLGLEEQQRELAQVLEGQGIRRDGNVVTLMRMADVTEATHRPDVLSTPPRGGTGLGEDLKLIPLTRRCPDPR